MPLRASADESRFVIAPRVMGKSVGLPDMWVLIALSAGTTATLAFTNTLLAPAATLAAWTLIDLLRGGAVTAVGAATAIVVGLVVITPAAGFVGPTAAIAMGINHRANGCVQSMGGKCRHQQITFPCAIGFFLPMLELAAAAGVIVDAERRHTLGCSRRHVRRGLDRRVT